MGTYREHSKPFSCDRLQLTWIIPFLKDHTTRTAKIREPRIMRVESCVLPTRVHEITGPITASVPAVDRFALLIY